MNINRFKNYLGKEGLYFHGASNDKYDNPDHKKIRPPSPKHPFFVSDNPIIAYRYADLETDDLGRVSDSNTEFTENSRIYILRLKEDVAKTKNYFDFTDKSDLESLRPLFSCDEGFAIFKKLIFENNRIFFHICLSMANLDTFDIHDRIAGKPNPMKLARELMKYQTGVDETLDIASLYGSLAHHFKHQPDRREIKTVFFKFILENLHIKVIGEYDTWGSYWHANDKIAEFGILDMSVIRDIYPFPIPYAYADRASILTRTHFGGTNPLNLSLSSYFLSLVDFFAKNPKMMTALAVRGGNFVIDKWVKSVTEEK